MARKSSETLTAEVVRDETAKPRQQVGHKTDRKILLAARGLFLQFGYDGVNLERIAELAGVSRQTLYNRFKSKEAIFVKVLEQQWEAVDFAGLAFGASPQSNRSAEAYLRNVADRLMMFAEEFNQVAFIRLIIAESRQMVWIAEEFYRVGKKPMLEGLCRGLSQLQERGLIRCPNIEIAALQYLGIIQEGLIWPKVMAIGAALNHAPPHTLIVDEAIATFMARYGVKASP